MNEQAKSRQPKSEKDTSSTSACFRGFSLCQRQDPPLEDLPLEGWWRWEATPLKSRQSSNGQGLSPWRWHKEVLSVLVWISNRWYNCWLSITWCPAFKSSLDITKCITLNLLLFLISCWLSIIVFYLNEKATKSGGAYQRHIITQKEHKHLRNLIIGPISEQSWSCCEICPNFGPFAFLLQSSQRPLILIRFLEPDPNECAMEFLQWAREALRP